MESKCILVGVSGGIAAYKVCELVSTLKKAGHDVHVLMTAAAEKFVGPLTFQTLSGNRVVTDLFSRDENPVTLSGYQFFTGGMILAVIGLLMGGSLDFSGMNCVLNLLYLGFISAGAYTMWGVLLKYNPVSRVSILGFVNPVMGVLLSALFLGEGREAFSLTAILALFLVSAGIVIVNTAQEK